MHELAATQSLVDMVLAHAREQGADSVRSARIRVGALNDYIDETLIWLFGELTRGTEAEQARLEIHRSPIRLECADCAATFLASREQPLVPCADCGSDNTTIIEGREFVLESIEVQ